MNIQCFLKDGLSILFGKKFKYKILLTELSVNYNATRWVKVIAQPSIDGEFISGDNS